MFGGCGDWPYNFVIVFPADHVADVLDRSFNFGREERESKVASGRDGDRKGIGSLREESFAEPASGEVHWKSKFEECSPNIGALCEQIRLSSSININISFASQAQCQELEAKAHLLSRVEIGPYIVLAVLLLKHKQSPAFDSSWYILVPSDV